MRLAILIGISFGLILGCGSRPKVSSQRENKLVLPKYHRETGGTFLTDGDRENYDGSMLLWDNTASAEQIIEISKWSDKTKLAESAAVTFYKDHASNIVKIAKLRAKRLVVNDEAQADLARRRAENDLRQRSQLVANSHDWLTTKLDAFVAAGTLNPEEKQIALEKFASYCEAKLWEMASSSYLMSFNYRTRPTPNPICEFIYEQKGLLSQSTADCQDPTRAGQAKDYFQCFWQEGVFKTDFWLKKYSDQDQAEKVAALIRLTQSGAWKESVLARTNGSNLAGGKFFVEGLELKASTIVDYPFLGKKKLGKWIEAYEEGKVLTERNPLSPELWLFSLAVDTAEFVKTRRAIQILGRRDVGFPEVAPLDLIYNGSIADGSLTAGIEGQSHLYSEMGSNEFPELFGMGGNSLKNISAVYSSKLAKIDQNIKELLDANQGWAALEAELSELPSKALPAAVSPGAALELWSSAISVERLGGVYRIVVGFAPLTETNRGTFYGCADIESGDSVDCPEAIAGLKTATVTFKPDMGRFILAIAIEPGGAVDVAIEKARNADLMKLDFSVLNERTLEITLDPTIVQGLKYYTGALRIIAPGLDDITGSVTMSSYGATIDAYAKKYGSFK